MGEPTNALAVQRRLDLLEQATGSSVVIAVTPHDVNLPAAFSDRLVCVGRRSVFRPP
ncbi:hypothetical protein [Nocardia lijiangensis]|uniref:hypothetical protein n=1 Tax=Nocardia lijiangensis TaxID=299618 RepID=UPI000A6E7E13|nr:hypothetical protein [Nocardia lijiangensis]